MGAQISTQRPTLFASFLALYLILMDLFLCFCHFYTILLSIKSFDTTCKTYKYAKLKTLSLQNCILHKKIIKSVGEAVNLLESQI